MPRLKMSEEDLAAMEALEKGPECLPWSELPGLHDVFGTLWRVSGRWRIQDEDVTRGMQDIALVFLRDAQRYGLSDKNEFLGSVAERDFETLSLAQLRGVLNVLSGQIRAHRKRFFRSRDRRRDRYDSGTYVPDYSCCIVCGHPLPFPSEQWERGCGDTCWKRVCGEWWGW